MTIKKIHIHILIIVVFSLLLKIGIAYFLGGKFNPVTWEYEQLAQKLLTEGKYEMEYREYGSYRALLAPGYSFLCCAVYKIFGTSHKLILAIQFLLMTGFSITVYFLAKILFDDINVAFFAGILSALHPGLAYYSSVNLHNINLYMPLFYLSTLLFCLCFRTQSPLPFIALGISSGFAVLTRATFTPIFLLGLILYIILANHLEWKIRIRNASFAFIFFLSINLPWVIRNYYQFDKFIFSQNNKWEAFWVGNNPNASGGHYREDGTAVLSTKPPEMQAEINANKGNEIAIEEIFKKYSIQYIKTQPLDFIKGIFRKAFYFWWFYPQTGLFYPKSFLIAYKILYCLLLAFTAWGLYICHVNKLWRAEMIFPFLLLLGIWGAHTMNFMEMRHRWTVEPVLLILVAITLSYLYERIKSFYFSIRYHK